MELFAFVNDELVPVSRASLLISDLAIQRGYGIFDFFKTLDRVPVFLDEHLDRFFHSVSRLRLDIGKSREELKEMIGTLLHRNGIADSGVRLEVTGGYSVDGYTPARPNLLIVQQPLPGPINVEPTKGIRLMTYAHLRQLPDIKTIDYLMAIWLQPHLREQGADDVLYHRAGVISECPRSNFFLVTGDGRLVTPGRDILKGITRMKILGMMEAEERDVQVDELRTAREAFITSTTKHVLPVIEVDGVVIGDGKIGPVAKWLSGEIYQLAKQT